MIVIGIDPGTRITGYGIVKSVENSRELVEYGCICSPEKFKLSQRYHFIFNRLEELLEKYQPDVLAVETQFVNKNAQSAIKLGMARGMAILAASRKEIPIFEYSPTKAKSAIVGNGRANKTQVQNMVKILLNLSESPQSQDAADALAIALCHLQASTYHHLMGSQIG